MPYTPETRSRVTVLLVDDEPTYLEALELVLEQDGRIEVAGRAADGAEALERALELRPDVVLMDVHMPGTDGVEATARITELLAGTAVVMLSSSAEDEDMARSYDAGALAYLTKDLEAERLVEAILGASDRTTAPAGSARAVAKLVRRALGASPALVLPAPAAAGSRAEL